MPAPQLLSTDFDGTLVELGGDGRCRPALAGALREFVAGGGIWVVNTGRSLDHILEGLELFGAPVEPHFLVTLEREIHARDSRGRWLDLGDWNARCRSDHEELFGRAQKFMGHIVSLSETSPDVTAIYEGGRPVGVVTSTHEVMDGVADFVRNCGERPHDLGFQRNTIYLRFCHADYHKGSALGELARHLSIGPEAVMAIGDQFNDLPMLDGRFAHMTACPANAIGPVRESVRASGGYLAASDHADGATEAIRHFRDRDTRR